MRLCRREFGLLRHQRQPESGAGVRCRRSAGEPLEHQSPFLLGIPDPSSSIEISTPARELTADSWTREALPCLTALAMALSTANRSPAGSPTMITVGAGTSDTSSSG